MFAFDFPPSGGRLLFQFWVLSGTGTSGKPSGISMTVFPICFLALKPIKLYKTLTTTITIPKKSQGNRKPYSSIVAISTVHGKEKSILH